MSAQPRKVVHPDIKPENTPALASGYLDVPNMRGSRPSSQASGSRCFIAMIAA